MQQFCIYAALWCSFVVRDVVHARDGHSFNALIDSPSSRHSSIRWLLRCQRCETRELEKPVVRTLQSRQESWWFQIKNLENIDGPISFDTSRLDGE